MRLKLSRFRRNFNKDLPIEFTEQNLSSFGGLELFSRYLRRVELSRRVGKACRGKGIRSDYGSVRLVLVLVGILLVGARRLEHLQYVCDDPMLLRFCGLRRLPSRPTIVNWLKQFTGERLKGLSELNGVLVHEQIERLGLNRLTVDMDGTVVQAGNQVGWAFRGFNPHRKKNKSCYPLFAHLAQTGQILKSRNRPGNVHDSKGADAFLRELIGELRGQFGRSRKLEFRTDAAFFNEKILKRLERSRSEFDIERRRTSSSTCFLQTTATSSTQPSPPTNRSPSNAFGTSLLGEAAKRKPSPNCAASSLSTSCPLKAMPPIAPGNS